MTLDPEVCYRALQTKDTRFDGQFFVAVYTTGIFCRPICPANTPQRQNCTFFLNAAAAQGAGFRPCLRCRPELAPHLLAHLGTGTTVAQALQLIAAGALDQGSVAQMPKSSTKAISALAAAVVQTPHLLTQAQTLDESIHTLCQLPGIGDWTAHYIAMRALREPDAFPTGDLGLLRAIATLGYPMTKAQLLDHAQVWRPWRAYAAMQLWSMSLAG